VLPPTYLHQRNELIVAILVSPIYTVKTKKQFWGIVPVLGVKPKRGWYVFGLFFKINQSSFISFKRSRRELSIDVAEHRSILKNKGEMRNLIIFQDSPMFSHIIQKVSARAFH